VRLCSAATRDRATGEMGTGRRGIGLEAFYMIG
jgi:hypothetical protein